jgi:hypothetical protein
MPKKPAKSRQNRPKEAKLYTPEPVQARVIARYVNGESNRQIATEEKIDRGTVSKILSQQEALQMIARQRCRLQSMADKALDVVEQALNGDDPRLALPVAMKIVENVLPKGGIEETISIANKASPEVAAEERMTLMLGQITRGSLEKSMIYKQPLSPKMEELVEHLHRGIEQRRVAGLLPNNGKPVSEQV